MQKKFWKRITTTIWWKFSMPQNEKMSSNSPCIKVFGHFIKKVVTIKAFIPDTFYGPLWSHCVSVLEVRIHKTKKTYEHDFKFKKKCFYLPDYTIKSLVGSLILDFLCSISIHAPEIKLNFYKNDARGSSSYFPELSNTSQSSFCITVWPPS